MISVLLPSRQRAKLFKDCVELLGKGDFEVLVRVDNDDPELEEYYKQAEQNTNIIIVPGERVGYTNFHLMINELAEIASGQWLMLYNDDAMMLTPNWADIIHKHDYVTPKVLNFYDPGMPLNNLFPVISRPMYRIMGHYSLSTHCDSWVQDIANELGIHEVVYGIDCKHIRETLHDETKQHSSGAYAITSPLHDSPEMVELRYFDMAKIREKL